MRQFLLSFVDAFVQCALAPPAELPGQFTRSSLGDLANLDDFYDSTTDHFTGQSVITGSTQPLTVTGTLVMNSYY